MLLLLPFAVGCFFQPIGRAQVKEVRRVLIFYEMGLSSPGVTLVDQGIRARLQNSPYQIELYREYLETTLFPAPSTQEEFRRWYIHKYQDLRPDLIIAVGPAPLKFLADSHERGFGGVPIVFCTTSEELADHPQLDGHFTGVWEKVDAGETLDEALRLQPGTKHLVVVGGTTSLDRHYEALVRKDLDAYTSRLDITYLTDLAMPDLLERLKHLSEHTVVLLTDVSEDAAGTKFVASTQATPMVINASNAPVFSLADVDLGHGEVGGDVISFAKEGEIAGNFALRILRGEKPQDIPIVPSANAYMFDWRAMQHWGMKESNLPPGSIVINRPPSLWQLYERYALAAISLILAQMLAILGLLWQRARRKKAEKDLVRINERLRQAMESGKSVGWELELASGHNRWFGDLQTMFGIPSNMYTAAAGDFYHSVHPEDRDRVSKAVAKARLDREPYNEEFRVIRADGTARWVSARGEFQYAPNGEARMMRGMAVDITERKQVDEALKKSEEKFAKAFRESPLALSLTSTKDHRYIDVNETFERLTGWSRAEIVGQSALDSGIWVDPSQRIELVKRLLVEGTVRDVEIPLRTRDGQVRTSLGSAELIEVNGEPCVLAVIADITEVKQAEDARRVSEHRFSAFFSTLPEYGYMTSSTGEILNVNPAACEALGYTREELLGKPLSNIYAPESALKLVNLLEKWKRTNKLQNEEMVILTKEGKKRIVLLNASAVKDAEGNVVYIASVQADITERKEILQKLRESEERFRSVANAAPVMIWVSGPDRLCTYFNHPWLEFTGRSLQEELGNGWVESVHSEDLDACLKTYSNAFDRRERFEMEYRLRRHDGEYRWVLDRGIPRFQQDGSFEGYIGSCIDVTVRKLAEESLADMSRKLIEAQEQERTWIARELHDDINQRITLVLVNLERLQLDSSPLEPAIAQRLTEVKEHLSSLASDIQSLSHRLHSSKLEYLGLATAAESLCREFSEDHGLEIAFHTENIPKQLPREIALCLFRVLQESLQNAFKHSGALHFEVWLKGAPNEIGLTVRDSGLGFDPEEAIRRRGLGLTSMKERLKLVHGKLSVESRLTQGTTIRATVPFDSGARAAGA